MESQRRAGRKVDYTRVKMTADEVAVPKGPRKIPEGFDDP